jgi:DNA polymerase-4
MPLRTAHKRCPDAVFLPVDAPVYLAASAEVMTALRSFPAIVQVLGWDEAFIAAETDDPEALARDIQRTVLERTRLWCSIGVGDSRLRAKLASGFAKPRGVFRLTRAEWRDVMGSRPTSELWGIGSKTAGKLAELGIATVDELAAADEELLATRFGPRTGPWIRSLATGEDDGEVTDEPYVARGRGREHTFQDDLRDADEIRDRVRELAHEVGEGLSRPVVRVIVKVRFAPFFTHSHGAALETPTTDEVAVVDAALRALARFELDRPVRLLGVRVEFEREPSL